MFSYCSDPSRPRRAGWRVPARALASLLAVLVTLTAVSQAAFADSVQNNVVATGNNTINLTGSSAGSIDVSYHIANDESGTHNGANSCDAKTGSAAVVSFNVAPAVTVSPTKLTFTDCDKPQTVRFTSSTPNDYSISVSVSDDKGSYNTTPANFTLKVRRANSAPTVTVGGVAQGANYEKGAVPDAVCNVTDAEDGAKTFAATLSAVSGSLAPYGLGSQTASCSYTDAGGLTGSASATYSIVDTVAPALIVPGDTTAEATSSTGASVSYAATAKDAVDPAPAVSCTPASGSTFSLGATQVACWATDVAGNRVDRQFTVTVQDTTMPVLTLPADITREATGPTGAAVTYAASATDTVDGSLTPACTPASGATFTLGGTPVNCWVSDKATNKTTGGFNVSVVDTTKPVLSLPGDRLLEATGPGGAVLVYTATATDTVDTNVPVSCDVPSGTTFKLGSTTVSCQGTDDSGNLASGKFTVTVQDTTAPTVALPGNITAEATKAEGREIEFFPSASDLVDGDVPVSCTPASGGTFAMGTTTVACSATDQAKNSAGGQFTVTVTDTTPPSITAVPGDATVEATGSGGAPFTYTLPTASDIVDGERLVECAPASGSTFPLGSTTVNCAASDTRSNGSQASFQVKVVDTTAPEVRVPANLDLDATGPSGAPATWSPVTASDIVDGSIAATCDRASGSTFEFGTTKVTCTATDKAGHKGENSFTVSVSDKSAPDVTVPGNQKAEATGPNGAVVSWTGVSATDVVDGPIKPSCTPGSGSTFALGQTGVACTATDRAGNEGTGGFTVTVEDTTAPVVSVPAGMTLEATGPNGAAVTYAATANDIVDGAISPTCSVASGATLGLGSHTVTCSAADAAGNLASKSFAVTVVDTTGPALNVPADHSVEATSADGAVVSYSVTAADLVDGPVGTVCLPSSGSTFPLGATKVSCSAEDSRGNSSARDFTVTVRDTTAPVVNVPQDITVPATSALGAVVTYVATATDAVDTGVKPICTPASGSTFAAGMTTVTCSAKDAAGNTAGSKTFKVTVKFDSTGFLSPVDTNKVLNGMKAGSTVPLKWRVSNQAGGYISDLGIVKGSPAVAPFGCSTGALGDDLTEYSSGTSALKYDATNNQFVFNWQSPKKAGSCYQVTVTFTDGTSQSAVFQLR